MQLKYFMMNSPLKHIEFPVKMDNPNDKIEIHQGAFILTSDAITLKFRDGFLVIFKTFFVKVSKSNP